MLAAEQHARAAGRCNSGMATSTSYQCDISPLLRSQRSTRRMAIICQANEPKGPGQGNKADFSAYWSMKVRNFFSSRKGYLEGAEDKVQKRPQVLDWVEAEIRKEQEQIAQMEWEEEQGKEDPKVVRARLDQQAREETAKIMAPLEMKFLGRTLPIPPPPDEAQVALQEARAALVPSWSSGVSLSLFRAKQLVQMVLMAPWTLLVSAFTAWQAMFNTQHYEMFLMSEGERMWYWRNRTENERWFWEIFCWDRLLFPTICTVAYQYVVPSNLVWVVVVPAVFIMWQTGKLPGPYNLEFWLIAYFGVYKKCWHDIVGIASTLLVWA